MSPFFEQTRTAFLWTRLLNIPFWAIFNMLPIILYKDLQATPWQITAMVAIKPISALFASYWGMPVSQRQDRLVPNLVWANILKFLPFLCFPLLTNNWLFVLSFGFYMTFVRGVIPAWMEIIKLNVQGTARERVFAIGSVMDYLGGLILPLMFGWIFDDYPGIWRWAFFATAILGILSTFLLYRIPISKMKLPEPPANAPTLQENILKPWKESYDLLKRRVDFANYQLGFMFGGFAVMMIQTTLPAFFVSTLNLSYSKIFFAAAICKGIGFAVTSPWWVKWFDKIDIFRFSSWVTGIWALFPILLICAQFDIAWLYVAYLLYGATQAGSELSWHLSGPHFAKNEDSSIYSTVNVLTVGIRGCIAPLFGSLLYTATNSTTVMVVSVFFYMVATVYLRKSSKEWKASPATPQA